MLAIYALVNALGYEQYHIQHVSRVEEEVEMRSHTMMTRYAKVLFRGMLAPNRAAVFSKSATLPPFANLIQTNRWRA